MGEVAVEPHRDPEAGEQVEGDPHDYRLPVEESPDQGERHRGQQGQHRQAGKDRDHDPSGLGSGLSLVVGKRSLAFSRYRVCRLLWREVEVGSGGHHGSSWARRGRSEERSNNRGHGPSEYAYVTVAYGTVGFPGHPGGIFHRFLPLHIWRSLHVIDKGPLPATSRRRAGSVRHSAPGTGTMSVVSYLPGSSNRQDQGFWCP